MELTPIYDTHMGSVSRNGFDEYQQNHDFGQSPALSGVRPPMQESGQSFRDAPSYVTPLGNLAHTLHFTYSDVPVRQSAVIPGVQAPEPILAGHGAFGPAEPHRNRPNQVSHGASPGIEGAVGRDGRHVALGMRIRQDEGMRASH